MKRGGSVSGVVSLVMIFCVLCMAVFSGLTMVTAQREHALATLTAQRAGAYYDADRQAVQTIAEIEDGKRPDNVTFQGNTASFAIPAGGDTILAVKVLLTADGCEIQQWQTLFNGDWETDDTIEVWGGM